MTNLDEPGRLARAMVGCLLMALAAVGPAHASATSVPGATEARPTAAPGRPRNVLVVLTDDVGFAASSAFGGAISTPTFDALAREGLRYTNFHTAAMCSPTRAALLTGRDPHAVQMGSITEGASADPGYTSVIPKSAATLARVLQEHGYRTAMFGKYHLIPKWELSTVGPFDRWPTSMGFDYFYGFEPATVDQFTPNLIENTRLLAPPADPDYFFERDLADRAIHWMRESRAADGDRPLFLYFATAATHAPVQAPADWIAKYRGRFDRGWDVEREETLARQQRLGIVPPGAVLTPRAAGVPAWDSLTADQKRVAARLMEVHAAMLSYTDHQIGRVVAELRAAGRHEDTLVIYIQGDNGATPEGGREGVHNYYLSINAIGSGRVVYEDGADVLARLDELGGPKSAPAIPTGWTNALSTPFPGWKGQASDLGSVRNGMVVAWPGGIRDAGAIRTQFHTVQDIAPTVYEALGITPPATVDGVVQQPLDGISLAYSFADGAAPSRRREAYFENAAMIGMYRDGWWACYRAGPGESLGADLHSRSAWRLFDLREDFSQSRDVAADQPRRLEELKLAFASAALRNHLFPIRAARPLSGALGAMDAPGRYVLYPGTERYSDWGFPNVRRRSWSLAAHVEVPPDGASGVVVNQGGRFAGWALLMQEGVPQFVYRRGTTDDALLRLRAAEPLPAGAHVIEVRFAYRPPDGTGTARASGDTADVELRVDGATVAQGALAATARFAFMYQGAAIGHSTGSALLDDYSGPFAFTGRIEQVEFELEPR